MRLHIAALFFIFSLCPANGQAVEPGGGKVENTEVKVHARTVRGQLNTCELEYLLWFNDHYASQGRPVALRGALAMAWLKEDQLPIIIYKIRGSEFKGSAFSPFDISYGYLSAAGSSLARKETTIFKCEGDGACISYPIETLALLIDGAYAGFRLAYLRKGSSQDVVAPLKIPPQQAQEFVACTTELLDAVKKSFK
jgi:hypothetical protein